MLWPIFLLLYVAAGLILVPHLNKNVPPFDFASFFRAVAWAVVWPVTLYHWYKANKK